MDTPTGILLIAPPEGAKAREALQRAAEAGAAALRDGAAAAAALAAAFAALARPPACLIAGAAPPRAGAPDGGPPLAGVARDLAGALAAASAGAADAPALALPARHAPGAGLAVGDWGAAVALGGDALLWRLTPAARLCAQFAQRAAPAAAREVLFAARAAATPLALAGASASGEFAWGFFGAEPARGYAGESPLRQAKLEPR